MSRFEQFKFFSYTWSSADEETNQGKQAIIRCYGWCWNEQLKRLESAYIRVEDTSLPVIVELDETIPWTEGTIRAVCNRLQTLSRLPEMRPKTICYEERERLYYAHVDKLAKPDPTTGQKYTHKKFPCLMVSFASAEASSRFAADLKRELDITGIGKVKLRVHGADRSITPVIKFLGIRQLPSAGWMYAEGIRMNRDEQESTRANEYVVSSEKIFALSEEEAMKMPTPFPKIMSFDNEANSTYMNSMPKAKRPGDKTFQIGYTMLDPPQKDKPKAYRKYLISMGNPDPIEGITIIPARTEADVYVALANKMREEDPEIVLGFNILGWDFNYMIERCESMCRCMSEFDLMGCILGKHAEKAEISWGSSGAGKNKFQYLNAEGRIFVDLLPYIKRNYKLPNYRLETVCEEWLKTNKDPVKPKDIFKAWRKWQAYQLDQKNETLRKESAAELARIGKYCAQDSFVCILLFEKLNVWADLTESATVNQVPIFDMFARGQQIKLFSQVFSYGLHNGIMIETNAYTAKDDEHYTGAYVSEPKRGLYDMIVPFDFCALYPSLMMAYNIDFSKLAVDPAIPDEDCHVMIWSEHSYCGCPKDEFPGQKAPKDKEGKPKRVCADYKYRWLTHEASGKGVLPILLENVIAARKKTRKIIEFNEGEIKLLKKILAREAFTEDNIAIWANRLKVYNEKHESVPALEIVFAKTGTNVPGTPLDLTEKEVATIKERIEAIEILNLVLDRRQNAYKVNANSMYGATGAKKGYLPFLPAAMCVTYKGRVNIQKVNRFIEDEKGGIVIYNDTDSCYCHFPSFKDKTAKELWAWAKQIAEDAKHLFPPPMSLDFENKIYKKFLILTKKRYAAVPMNEEGKLDSKLLKRGIILQRRDNCIILRQIYQDLIFKIFEHHETLVKLTLDVKEQWAKDRVIWEPWRDECEKILRREAEIQDWEIGELERQLTYLTWDPNCRMRPLRSAPRPKRKGKKTPGKLPPFPPAPARQTDKFILNHPVVAELLSMIVDAINILFQWKYGYKHFVITKQIARDFKEYKNPDRLPGHVQLGLRMQKRGIPVGGGTRVEYVILKKGPYCAQDTQTSKIEDVGYFSDLREILRLSYMDYLKQFITPIDELCSVVMGVEDFVRAQFDIRLAHSRVIDHISSLGKPRIKFLEPMRNHLIDFSEAELAV